MTLTSESTPPYLWHKPQKRAETQSFSPLLSNINQGNNDFQYVPILNTILNSPLEVESEAYAVFSDGTLTFYYDQNKPEGAYGMRTEWNDQWYEVADQITKVVFDKSFADYRPTSCGCWFGLCENLTTIEGMKEYLNTEKVESMMRMFESCNNLTTLDVSNFNTEKVIGIWNMFWGCSSLTTLDVSNFNIEKITYLSGMFSGCSSLTSLDLSNFNTENVIDMKYMFDGCSSLQTIYVGDKWTTKNVTDSEKMFYGCNNLYGGKGTAYNENFIDATYANIDGSENGKPGYFTKSGEQPWVDNGTITWLSVWNSEYLIGTDLSNIGFSFGYDNGDNSYGFLNDSEVEVLGLNTDEPGVQNVTVSYRGYTWQGKIEIYKPVASFDFSNVNTNLNLNANEKLSGCVTVTNEDGTTYDVDITNFAAIILKEGVRWSYYLDYNDIYDKTIGEHEFVVNYRGHDGNLKYTFYNGPAPAKPYVILADKTITFYSGETIPEGAIELQPSYEWDTPWAWGDYETVVFDKSFKNYKPTSTGAWFFELASLKEIKGLENLNTEKVTDMRHMFSACSLIESLDLSGFDVSNVTNMDAMFAQCDNLHTIFVGDNWNLSDNLSSNNMFAGCYSLYGEQGSMPESYKVYDASMARIDGGDNAPGYFTKKGNSKATVTSIDFSVNPHSEHTLGEPINRESGILNVNFSNREAQQLPYNHVNITPSGYDSTRVGKQIVTVKLLNATTTYEVNVTAKDTSYAYLDDNDVLTLYYGEYKQGAIFGSYNRFNNPGTVKKVIIDKSFANYHPTTCYFWFESFNNMTEIKGLENLNTQYVTDMRGMFSYCNSLTSLDVSNFKTDNVMYMSNMFDGCSNLTTLDISNFKTENVTEMYRMFFGCSSLTSLDVSNFNTDNVMYMGSMFGDCYNLKTIYVGDKWTTKNVTESENMFKYSNNLYSGKGTAYNADFIDATYAHIDDPENGKPGYFTKSGEPAFVPPIPYVILADKTITFYSGETIPEGAIELQPSYYFNTPWLGGDYETIVFDESFKNYKPTSTATWFLGLFNLKEIKGLENLNTEKVTDMQYMFNSCSLIESLDLSGFDVSNVTDMTGMFTNCDNLHTIFVGDNWNLSDNLPSTNMFADCYSLYGEQGSMPESYKVYDASMAQIDGGDNAPGYFTKKGNSKATVTSIDFSVNPYSEHTLGEPINRQSGILNVYFNNREAQYLQYNHVNITPSGYDSTRVGKQTVTVKLLNATTTYEVNVTAKDTSYAYLDDNGVLTLYYGEYKQGAIFGSKNLFNNPGIVKKVIIDKSFANYHPTTCAEWFQFFNNMTEIKGLENLNTQYVTDMSRMFYSLQTLTTIDVSKLNTENVTSMSEMFTDCHSLTTLDISNFNTEKVSDMSRMFGDCDNLKTIYVGDKWTTKNITESENMFNGCNNLYGGKGTAYNADFTDATYARIDGGVVAPGYFTLKINNPYTKPEIKDDFYQIGNMEELLWFVFDVNNGDTKANAQLTNDIVVNKDCMERITKLLGISKAADDLTVWQPIGTLNNAYAGIFDGQGHYISGIYINNKNEENVGLFGVTSADAVIKNIGITDSYIAAKENVGAIVGNNNGIVANCYSTATIESEPNAQNVNGIAGKVSENAVVANSYYLTSEANTNDPQAKTLAEFKSGEVAQLLAEGATINGEKISGESFAGIVDLPGTENLEELTTPTSELTINSNIRIWSFENTIFVENGCNKIEIVDMAGRVVKQVTPNSNRTEISLSNSGVYIVKTGVKTQKVIVR